MEVTDSQSLEIIEQSQVNDARRQIVRFAKNLGFEEKLTDRLALICTELGTNLIKHTAQGGRLVVQGLTEGDNTGVEIYSFDSGKGMNTAECMVDGFSTVGTLGTGLGALQRLTDEFTIHSAQGVGTVAPDACLDFGSHRAY